SSSPSKFSTESGVPALPASCPTEAWILHSCDSATNLLLTRGFQTLVFTSSRCPSTWRDLTFSRYKPLAGSLKIAAACTYQVPPGTIISSNARRRLLLRPPSPAPMPVDILLLLRLVPRTSDFLPQPVQEPARVMYRVPPLLRVSLPRQCASSSPPLARTTHGRPRLPKTMPRTHTNVARSKTSSANGTSGAKSAKSACSAM
ncbi:hypothetical protein BD311DRAFT_554446, partial [Dichomitus squalens]